jgi:hypothetical protein
MGIDAGKLRGPSRRTQGKRDEVGQRAEKIALAILGIAGFEGIIVLVPHGSALMLSCVTPEAQRDRYASQRLRRR